MGYIYIILNTINYKFYIGSTKNFHVRKLKHINELNKNKHHSVHLQRAWNKYNKNSFKFIIIENCLNIIEREQEILNQIDLKNNTYNVSGSATGGDLLSNHPNKEKLIKQATENLLNAPKRKKSCKKENNPNWKGGKTYCKCGIRVNSSTKTCIKCQNKSGTNNPFFGKKHSEETKQRLSKIRKGTYNGNQEKCVIIDNKEFASLSAAARFLKVSPATIVYRIKSKNFNSYKYKNESRTNK